MIIHQPSTEWVEVTQGDTLRPEFRPYEVERGVQPRGLATGPQALARLLSWRDAQFELRPELEPADAAQPAMTVAAALLSASVERDELSLHGAARLDPETVFSLDRKRLRALARSLDDFAQELAENAALGFPLAALIDFVDAGDTRFYRTLSELVDSGPMYMLERKSTTKFSA